MILKAKAKPVKIRITSGGEEHSSLESLRNNFKWDDISKLFDGRLVKWLRRIDELEKAQMIEDIKDPEKKVLEIYNILFPHINIENKDSLFFKYEVDELLEAIVYEVIKNSELKDILDIYIQNKYKKTISFIINLLGNLEFSMDSFSKEELFKYGKILYERNEIRPLGQRFIDCGVERGDRKALLYRQKLDESNDVEITDILLRNSTLKLLNNSWETENPISLDDKYTPLKEICEFSNNCLDIFLTDKLKKTTSIDLQELAKHYFADIPKDSKLFEEKKFILSILTKDKAERDKILKEIKDYFPANQLLTKGQFDITNLHDFKANYPRLNAKELKFFILHLGEFRSSPLQKNNQLKFIPDNEIKSKLKDIYSDIKEEIKKSWTTHKPITKLSSSEMEKELIDFSNFWLEIFKQYLHNGSKIINTVKNQVEDKFKNTKLNSSLFKEITLLYALFGRNSDEKRNYLLNKISDYKPAKALLLQYKFYLGGNYSFHLYYTNNFSALPYYITHLDEYSE